MNATIKLLIITLVVAAIGHYTSTMVGDTLRLRRRSSRRQTELMIEAANIRYGKFGIGTTLLV